MKLRKGNCLVAETGTSTQPVGCLYICPQNPDVMTDGLPIDNSECYSQCQQENANQY